ncbi:MAG: PaaI family thioesterase [Rhodocyclaceae bacterium]|jgi:uncharacterized protein (TIGR00369 family)|nr:PaaI family thioesterase [Rhodocyclaceae bacterium]
MSRLRPGLRPEHFHERGRDCLPGRFGIEALELAEGRLRARMAVAPHMLAPNGFLHAASVIALADTACGYATVAHLPDGCETFTTLELKSNFLGTVREGAATCEARLAHWGKTTQVWDATVSDEATGRTVALFRCTQMMLWPK